VKRYVLTGGHGVGKSSIILALERMGEHVVFEAASSVRALDRAEGRPFPEDNPEFESKALALHLRRERLVSGTVRRLFLDRGAPDHLAYASVGRWPLSDVEIAACTTSLYDLAFLVEPPPGGVPTVDRVEANFCARLVVAIERIYADLGIPVVRVPYAACPDRALFILNTVTIGSATLTVPSPSATTESGTTPLRRTQP
jgi:predicted ATPase